MFEQRAAMRVGGRVECDDVDELSRQARLVLERRPGHDGEPADAPAKRPRAMRRVRRDDEYALARGDEVTEEAGDADPLPVPQRAVSAPRGDGRSGQLAIQLTEDAVAPGRLADHVDRLRRRRLGAAEHEPWLDRAVVSVGLEADGGVDGLARLRRERAAGAEGHTAGAG